MSKTQRRSLMMVAAVATMAIATPAAADAEQARHEAGRTRTDQFAAPACEGGCGSGSTIGPDKALYVTDGPGRPRPAGRSEDRRGQAVRERPAPGNSPCRASAERSMSPLSAHRVRARHHVGPVFGQPLVVNGIYRIEQDGSATPIADIGGWSIAHPPPADFFVTTGVQYALQEFRGGLLVTDGHHNRVLRVSRHGDIRQLTAFENVVPTGLDIHGSTIDMDRPALSACSAGRQGREIHVGVDGRDDVASGAPLIVDVEFGRGRQLYALAQASGSYRRPQNPGEPAAPTPAGSCGSRRRQLRVRRRRAGPADFPRLHRQHRLRHHPHRQADRIDDVTLPALRWHRQHPRAKNSPSL